MKSATAIAFGCLLIGVNACMAQPAAPLDATRHYECGEECFGRNDNDGAIVELTAAIGLDPRFANAYAVRGAAYAKKGCIDKAAGDFTEAARLDRKSAFAHTLIGWWYGKNGDDDAAIRECTEAVRLDPKYGNAYDMRGRAHVRKGDKAPNGLLRLAAYAEAVADFTTALGLEAPHRARIYSSRGYAHSKTCRYGKAISDHDEAIRLSGGKDAWCLVGRAGAHLDRALHFVELGSDGAAAELADKTIPDCAKALALDPENAGAFYCRGSAYSLKRDFPAAIRDLSECIRRDPKCINAYLNRGTAHFHGGDADRCIADCTEAIRLDGTLPKAHFIRGMAYHSKGDGDRAIADYSSAIRINPTFREALQARGNAYLSLGERAKGIADLEEAKKFEPCPMPPENVE